MLAIDASTRVAGLIDSLALSRRLRVLTHPAHVVDESYLPVSQDGAVLLPAFNARHERAS